MIVMFKKQTRVFKPSITLIQNWKRLLRGSLTMFLFGWKLDTNFLYNCTYCDNRIDNYVDNNDTSMYMKELRMYL